MWNRGMRHVGIEKKPDIITVSNKSEGDMGNSEGKLCLVEEFIEGREFPVVSRTAKRVGCKLRNL